MASQQSSDKVSVVKTDQTDKALNRIAPSGYPYDIDCSQYSKQAAPYLALFDWYFDQVRRQEQLNIEHGYPAEGLTDFLAKWFHAWEQRDYALLRDCMADNIVAADPTSGGSRTWEAGQEEGDLYHMALSLAKNGVMFPQEKAINALPYYCFLDGNVRVTLPYRMIWRFKFFPRVVEGVGVDRYILERDPERGWLIARIDTDQDLLNVILQCLPIPLATPSQETWRRLVRIITRVFPKTRAPQFRPFDHTQ